MAVLLSRATGNFTDASTWALVDATSYLNGESASTISTSYTASNTFTPGAITIDAIAVKVASRSASPSGTISVSLTTAVPTPVAGTEVTINLSDVSLCTFADMDGGWYVFKFAASVTLTAATAYAVQAKVSAGATVIQLAVLSGTNWSRMLRTTTTQAPVAGDDLVVSGEHTGAGSGNDLVVVMNETVATDYGSATTSTVTPALAVCKRGMLDYSGLANRVLRLSGHLIIYNGGTFNMGRVESPVSRSARVVLEFDPISVDGDVGLIIRNGGTWNGQGQSRTSGKNVVSCKLAADAPSAVNLISGVIATQANVVFVTFAALGPDGISRMAGTITDNVTNSGHVIGWAGTSVNNTTQVFSIWLARGTGTNNRYCRVLLGSSITHAPSNGFYVDVDLQAGTVGTVTAVGTGTATSASITAVGTGYVVTIIGKVSSGSVTSNGVVCCSNASGTVSYAGDATNNLIYYGQQLFTASALPSADLTVDTDTGWLTGDLIAVASTTRTAADCEILALASNATSTTLTSTQVITNNHSGTSPTQAEIINLTRNVVVRSTSSTLMTYVNVQPGSTVDLDWVEFYYLGTNAGNKRGIDISASTTLATNFDMEYCSLHDCEAFGVYAFGTGSGLLTKFILSWNVFWNLATAQGPGVQLVQAMTPTNWTLDHNILIRTGSGNCFSLSDVGGTFTNNVAVGAATTGISLTESNGLIGTFSGNVAHSNTGNGMTASAVGLSGTVASCTAWRNASTAGFSVQSVVGSLLVSDFVAFGNITSNVNIGASGSVRFKSPVLNGDTTFSTASGFNINSIGTPMDVIVEDGDLGTVSGIKTSHVTADFNVVQISEPLVTISNTKCNAPTEVLTPTQMTERGYISSQKHDGTAANHVTWMKHGKVQSDATIYRTAAPSLRMTPSMAAHPVLGSLGPNVPVTFGSANITVPSYFFEWIAVNDWVVCVNGFSAGARVTALNSGTSTVTLDRTSTSTGTTTLVVYRGKLPSSPQGKGFKIPADSGQTFNVGIWCRKQQENLITYSEDFSNAAWNAPSALTATTGQSDPLDGTGATQFLETATNAFHSVTRATSITIVAGAAYTFTMYAKSINGRQWLRVGVEGKFTWFDIVNGVVGTVDVAHTSSISSVGSGWYRFQITLTASLTVTTLTVQGALSDNSSATYLGDVTKGFVLFGYQLEQGSTASAYQKTTTTAISGYNGYVNPRLIQRANPALGINDEVVLDTMTAANGTWEQLTGTTTAPTGDKGLIELYVDCEGTTGWVNVDDFTVT